MENAVLSDPDVLARLGASDAALLGSGGEARVYSFGKDRVIRIMRPGASAEDAEARAALLREIASARGDLPFLTPAVAEVVIVGGRAVAIEQRLPGKPVADLLEQMSVTARRDLLEDYLDTALRVAEFDLERPFFGPLIGKTHLRAASWAGYASACLRESARRCPEDLREAVQREAACERPEPAHARLVHLDYYPANVLAESGRVSAVLDFGATTVMGDARMTAWSAVAYLGPPAGREEDRLQAIEWLDRNGLTSGYDRARRWLAAYWTRATDDANLMDWCRRVLLANE